MHIKYLKLIRKIIDLLDFFPAIAPWALYKTAKKHIYTWSGAADVTSLNLLYYICNFHFVVAIVIVQMCLAFKKKASADHYKRDHLTKAES
jgi:hypothetical protein